MHTIRRLWSLVLCACLAAPLTAVAWKNPARSPSLDMPLFGTHDWIAFQGYKLAGRPEFIRRSLNRFFTGTEAPDNGLRPDDAGPGYQDAGACHCILFDAQGNVTRNRGELRVRQEYDKAVVALRAGNRRLAAFYAGAMAHYVGDLAQFAHVMGAESHWGSEDQRLHANYEVAVERTIRFQDRTSTLFEPFIRPLAIGGDSPETIARTVALRVERGTTSSQRTPRWMHDHYAALKTRRVHLQPQQWDSAFRMQTGQNLNVAANGVAKLLGMILRIDE